MKRKPGTLTHGILSVLAGALAASAFPPVDAELVVWVGLVPLLWIVTRSPSILSATSNAWLAGTVFWWLVLRPLVSAHVWSGWMQVPGEELAGVLTRQWWFLQGLSLMLAVWGGLSWGLFSLAFRRLELGGTTARLLTGVPALWVAIEWLRSRTEWGFEWGVLGHPAAAQDVLLQAASLGGVWFLSALVALANTALFLVLIRRRELRWKHLVVVASIFAAAWVWGSWRLSDNRLARESGEELRIGVLQFHRDRYVESDFLPIGLERSYLSLIRQALQPDPDLLVLPESISLAYMRLDEEPFESPRATHPVADWSAILGQVFERRDTALLLGIETVEQSKAFNSMVAWTGEGFVDAYHKRRLVPFSEYQPALWRGWLQGRSQYEPGPEREPIEIGRLRIGTFICQEVQFGDLTREAVKAGANLLVSGGNDGVFGDPAVAETHASMARIRAVETGRSVARAMKTGISAVIDSRGRELERSEGDEPVYLVATTELREEITPYVRLGDWPVVLAWIGVAVLGLVEFRSSSGRGARGV